MKKLKLLVVSALLITLVTGCGMKVEYGISISKDKNVKIEVLSAMDDEMIDSMMSMSNSSTGSDKKTDKERWNYLENDSTDAETYKDYEKEKYDKDGYKGYIYSLDLGNIDKVTGTDSKEVDFNAISEGTKIFTKKGNVYTLNIKQSDSDTQQMDQYGDSVKFDAKLKVTLPNKAKSNNATKVDGTTYIWDLTKAKDIKLSFELNGKAAKDNNKIIIIGGACAAAGIAISVVALVLSKKKKAA